MDVVNWKDDWVDNVGDGGTPTLEPSQEDTKVGEGESERGTSRERRRMGGLG